MNTEAFEKRLLGDEDKVARDEAKLGRDESNLDGFASALGVGPDQRLADNSGVLPNSDQFGPPRTPPVASDAPTAEEMMRASGVPVRNMSDAGGLYSPAARQNAEATGYQSPAPGEVPPRFLGARDVGGVQDPNGPPPAPPPEPTALGPYAPPPPNQGMQLTMPQPRFIGAHHDRSLVPDTAGTIGARVRNTRDMGEAVQDEMAAQRNQNRIVANNLQKQADDAEDRMLHRQVVEDQRQQYVAQRSAKLDKLIENVANQKEDPNSLYNNGDTGTKIALGIGAFFGGLIPGVKPLINLIAGNQERDIEAQRQNKKSQMAGLEMARGQLGDVRHDFDDQRSHEIAMESAQWANAQAQIKAQIARTDDPILQAKGREALVATQGQLTTLRQEYDRLSYVRPQVVGGGGSIGKGFVVKLPDGRQVLAPNEQKFNEMTSKSAQVSNIQSNLNKALSLRKMASPVDMLNPYSSVRKELASLKAETAQLVTVARGQGAMSKGDQEVADQAMGAIDGYLDNNNEVLSHTRDRLGEQLKREADAMGAEHVQTGYQVDQNGRLQRDVALTGESDKPKPNMPKGQAVR